MAVREKNDLQKLLSDLHTCTIACVSTFMYHTNRHPHMHVQRERKIINKNVKL